MTQSTHAHRLQDRMIGSIDTIMARTDRLFDTARPEAVFDAPVTVDGRTVIGMAEVLVAAGFGGGGGLSPDRTGEDTAAPTDDVNMGGGSGGGGYAQSRPVAVVIIDGNGTRVEPVVDVTKLGLAALTVFGSMAFMFGRMWRQSRRGSGHS